MELVFYDPANNSWVSNIDYPSQSSDKPIIHRTPTLLKAKRYTYYRMVERIYFDTDFILVDVSNTISGAGREVTLKEVKRRLLDSLDPMWSIIINC